MTIVPIRHKIKQEYIEKNSPLLFFRNALSFDKRFSDKSIPVQLSYPSSSVTLGFHPSFNSSMRRQLNLESEGVFDRPTMIISTECSSFESISMDLYYWGGFYIVALFALFIYIVFMVLNPIWMSSINLYDEFKWEINFKGLFCLTCFLLTVAPLIAVINRWPLLMIIYKASYPGALVIFCTFFINFLQDILFLMLFLLARFVISHIQYDLVSYR